MGRRKLKGKSDAQIEEISVNIEEGELSDQNPSEENVENGDDDPLGEVEDTDNNQDVDKALNGKKKILKKRAGQAGPKQKGSKKAKATKEVEVALDDNEAEEDVDYEVAKILDVQYTKSGGREFFIRWKGCGPESDTWEPEDNLCCPDLISEFIDQQTNPKKKGNKKKKTKAVPVQSKISANSDEEYEVEKILEVHHRRDGGKDFLIRWKGCNANEDTWEPEKNLNCSDLITKFMQKVDRAGKFEKREVRTAPKHTERFTLTMKSSGRRISKRNGNKQRATYYDAE